jgi:hypothetical protein
VKLEDVANNGSVSKNLTFDVSPLFTATIATTYHLDLSTPNIVKMTLEDNFSLFLIWNYCESGSKWY